MEILGHKMKTKIKNKGMQVIMIKTNNLIIKKEAQITMLENLVLMSLLKSNLGQIRAFKLFK